MDRVFKEFSKEPFLFVPSVVVVELDMVYKVAALAADTFACWVILETCEKSSLSSVRYIHIQYAIRGKKVSFEVKPKLKMDFTCRFRYNVDLTDLCAQ